MGSARPPARLCNQKRDSRPVHSPPPPPDTVRPVSAAVRPPVTPPTAGPERRRGPVPHQRSCGTGPGRTSHRRERGFVGLGGTDGGVTLAASIAALVRT